MLNFLLLTAKPKMPKMYSGAVFCAAFLAFLAFLPFPLYAAEPSPAVATGASAEPEPPKEVRFDIIRFQVDGNSILTPARVEQLVGPFVGPNKRYGDVQRALEALDDEYKRLGYGTVNVYAPEQELTSGVVKLQVTEAVVGKLIITGNKFFSEENVRATLPHLKEGNAPNMKAISENIQLANENPAKQIEVTMAAGDDDNKVDAKIAVTEENPDRFFVTLDNSGTAATGNHRTGFSYQNANLFNKDHVVTLAYTTAPDAPSGVKVDIFSIGYKLPLYSLGDSIDFIYGNSTSETPTVQATGLGIVGKGETFLLNYNHIFPRDGGFTSKLVGGLAYKYVNTRCSINNVKTDPNAGVASCTPHTFRPLTLTYSGQIQSPGQSMDFSLGMVNHAFPMGRAYAYSGVAPYAATTRFDRYSSPNGKPIKEHFSAYKFGGSYSRVLEGDWLARAAVTAQYTNDVLPGGEQLALAGTTAVRGFFAGAVMVDRGYVSNLEIYTPDWAQKIGIPGNLKFLAFYDFAYGANVHTITHSHIASVGAGFRYNFKKDVTARFDLGYITDGHIAGTQQKGDVRGFFSLAYGFNGF